MAGILSGIDRPFFLHLADRRLEPPEPIHGERDEDVADRARLETAGCVGGRLDHLLREHGVGRLDRGELELLLRSEMGERPLLLIPTASASRPIERPVIPSTVASWAASRNVADTVVVRPDPVPLAA